MKTTHQKLGAGALLLALAFPVLCPLFRGAFASDKPAATPIPDGQYRYAGAPIQPERPEDTGVFTMSSLVTAYCPCVICCAEHSAEHPNNAGTDFVQLTASGTVPTAGRTIAVDPDVIPIGSYVMIGSAVYVAEDTGSFIAGSDIDIFMGSHDLANAFGVKALEVTVYTPEHFARMK